jgi:hypothetical protein
MVAMSTQVVHSTPPTLGPFLKLILTLTLQCEAEMAERKQNPSGEAPNMSAAAAKDPQQKTRPVRCFSTHATTLGPFLTLLLTLHHASSWTDRDWWRDPTAPRGAALAARYVSR